MTRSEFQVRRDDLTQHRIVEIDAPALAEGEVRVAVDRFAFTANNLTYGVAGDTLGYWQFFPPADDSEDAWGILPVWGFGAVVESACPDVPVGDRLFGYLPPATSVVLRPIEVGERALVDGSPHRGSLPPLYNRYERVSGAPAAGAGIAEDHRALLQPLYLTSFALAHRLGSADVADAEQVVITSASSKTGLGLAFALASDPDAPTVIGVTSPGNVEFVAGTGLHASVVPYDAIGEGLPVAATVVVDLAGSATVAADLQRRLGEDLRRSINVGVTHWGEEGAGFRGREAPERQEVFFAPHHLRAMIDDLGPAELAKQSQAFLGEAIAATAQWMSVEHRRGLPGLAEVYEAVARGAQPPSTGIVVEI